MFEDLELYFVGKWSIVDSRDQWHLKILGSLWK
jgi:hypothetical protein